MPLKSDHRTPRDPKRTSISRFCCDAQLGFLNEMPFRSGAQGEPWSICEEQARCQRAIILSAPAAQDWSTRVDPLKRWTWRLSSCRAAKPLRKPDFDRFRKRPVRNDPGQRGRRRSSRRALRYPELGIRNARDLPPWSAPKDDGLFELLARNVSASFGATKKLGGIGPICSSIINKWLSFYRPMPA